MKKMLLAILLLTFAAQNSLAEEAVVIKDQNDKVNYSIGYQIGGDFVRQGVELQPEVIVQGIRDAVEQNQPLITQQEMTDTLVALKEQIIAAQREMANQAGEQFLAENRKKEGVVELEGGTQYRVLRAGSGASPTVEDSIKVHYRTLTTEGQEVSSTYPEGQPRSYLVKTMSPAFQDVILRMKEGAKWEIALVMTQAGNTGEKNMGLGVLIYEVELLAVEPAQKG